MAMTTAFAFDNSYARLPDRFYVRQQAEGAASPSLLAYNEGLASSLGLHQLRRAPALRDAREAMAATYDAAFADLPCTLPPRAPDGEVHAWHLYVLRLRDEAPLARDAFIEAMSDAGIGCSVHFIPLHLHPYWRDTYALRPQDFPVAQRTFERAVSLPLYTRMSPADQSRVIEAVRRLLGGA